MLFDNEPDVQRVTVQVDATDHLAAIRAGEDLCRCPPIQVVFRTPGYRMPDQARSALRCMAPYGHVLEFSGAIGATA